MPKFKGFPQVDSIVMGAGHSLMMGNKPQVITPEMVEKKYSEEKNSISSFGLFDNSTPNYATYYPDLKVEDLKPKDEEFIEPLFRMLSETIVHRQFNPIDFSKNGVLKKAMKLLIGQSVNIDHETAIGNAIGSVKEVQWQAAYETSDGIKVPAGINAVLKIDGKSNPRIARGIMMEPPSIHSNSVTVRFRWEKSHTELTDDEFYNKLGTFDDKGEMVRRIVTDIVAFSETSLVAHGADPFAQIIKDGKIHNPKFAEIQDSFSALKLEAEGIQNFYLDYKEDIILNSATESATLKNNNINQNQLHMKDKLILLASVIGLAEGTEFTEENFSDVIKQSFEAKTKEATDATAAQELAEGKVTTLETTVTELTQKNSDLETKVTELTTDATVGKASLGEARTEATRLYKLSVGEDKADAAILAVIEHANYETAKSFLKQYQEATEEKFELTCNDCKSKNVTRMSATTGKPAGNSDGGSTNLSNEEVRDSLFNKKRKPSIITSEEAE